MKKLGLGLLALVIAGATAHAVSIDFATYSAMNIGDVTTEKSEDGLTSITSVEFSGPGLKPFMALLPEVIDKEDVLTDLRMLNITNAGEKGVEIDNTSSIYIQCETSTSTDAPTCTITIMKGVIPG